MRAMDNFVKSWEEHRGIVVAPSFGAKEKLKESVWERLWEAIAHPSWAPGTIVRKRKEEELALAQKDMLTDSSVILAKFGGREDFSAQFAADKLKEIGYSLEDIRKLGKVYKDVK